MTISSEDMGLAAMRLATDPASCRALIAGWPVHRSRLDPEALASIDESCVGPKLVLTEELAVRLEGARPVENRPGRPTRTTSPHLAPTSPPGLPHTTSPPRPSPIGGEVVGDLAPDLAPTSPPAPHSWRSLDLVDIGSEPPRPPDIGGLFYEGKRHLLSGEDDAGKTMLTLAVAADDIRAGRGVIWVDTDDMGASAILERLRAFDAGDDEIRRLFAYMRPEEALTDDARDDLLALIDELGVRLMVNDAFNSSLTLHGLSPNDTEDVEAFWQRVIAPVCRRGVGAVMLDHVVKNREARGRYAYGSERKSTGSDVHLGLRVVEPFGRGRRGKAKITVNRDRIGFLERPGPGLFVLDSEPDTGRLKWKIEQEHSVGDDGVFRPTNLMEKVSRYLELRAGEACPRNQIENDVTGRRDGIRAALDRLVAEEFAVEVAGERGARLFKSVAAYREADEWESGDTE